jgi:tyrosine-specific transport protein
MQKVSLNRQIGSIFVIVGTEVGAGVLALPILIAKTGFLIGSIIMLCAWLLMTLTAVILCELVIIFPNGTSFAGMAKGLLNSFWQFVVWVSFLSLLYTIIVAYISAASSTFSVSFNINPKLVSLMFVSILGLFIILGVSYVDWLNRLLLSFKLVSLLFVCIVLMPHIKLDYVGSRVLDEKSILISIPVLVTAFTSHLVIPTLRTYLDSNLKVLVRVVIIGSIIPLILYFIWIVGVIGVIPHTGDNSFTTLFKLKSETNIGDILLLLKYYLNSTMLYFPISIFSNISVTTSFLGVALALFYFIIDAFKLNKLNNYNKNVIAIIFTFLFPLLVVYFFPNVFLSALSYVGLCCLILLVIVPIVMVFKLKQTHHNFQMKFIANKLFLLSLLFCGILAIFIQIYVNL